MDRGQGITIAVFIDTGAIIAPIIMIGDIIIASPVIIANLTTGHTTVALLIQDTTAIN